MEVGPDNIRVNAIQPGVVEGERIDRVIDAKAEARGHQLRGAERKLAGTRVDAHDGQPAGHRQHGLVSGQRFGANITGQAISVVRRRCWSTRMSHSREIEMEKIAIIGAGLIGRAWAMVFARAGHPVKLYDADPARCEERWR